MVNPPLGFSNFWLGQATPFGQLGFGSTPPAPANGAEKQHNLSIGDRQTSWVRHLDDVDAPARAGGYDAVRPPEAE